MESSIDALSSDQHSLEEVALALPPIALKHAQPPEAGDEHRAVALGVHSALRHERRVHLSRDLHARIVAGEEEMALRRNPLLFEKLESETLIFVAILHFPLPRKFASPFLRLLAGADPDTDARTISLAVPARHAALLVEHEAKLELPSSALHGSPLEHRSFAPRATDEGTQSAAERLEVRKHVLVRQLPHRNLPRRRLLARAVDVPRAHGPSALELGRERSRCRRRRCRRRRRRWLHSLWRWRRLWYGEELGLGRRRRGRHRLERREAPARRDGQRRQPGPCTPQRLLRPSQRRQRTS
mmetsp:Transcript_4165/g.14521  ORF Transcript_4165/g.14521 Transcript_4165/m.14521 type:complete len:298 (-) Transcript_4165:445-1338(-)